MNPGSDKKALDCSEKPGAKGQGAMTCEDLQRKARPQGTPKSFIGSPA